MDAQLRGLEGKLQKSLAEQAELEHRGRQIAIELNKGFEHAARYEELRLRLSALNQELTSAGVEIEASPELSNLDEEAFRPVEASVSTHQIRSLTEEPEETISKNALTESNVGAIAAAERSVESDQSDLPCQVENYAVEDSAIHTHTEDDPTGSGKAAIPGMAKRKSATAERSRQMAFERRFPRREIN